MADGSAQCSNQRFRTPPLLSPQQIQPSTPPPSPRQPGLRHSATFFPIPPVFAIPLRFSCEFDVALQFHSMASCVMSSSSVVAAAGPVAASAPRIAQAQANVLLSSRRASTISGVALPHLARSAVRTAEAKRSLTIVASKATRETSVNEAETSVNEAGAAAKDAAEDFYKSLKAAWDKSDDKPAIAGLGFAGLIGIWAAFGLIGAIERLPLIPNLFEIVGILFTGWFVYRYLLFKPDREELLKVVDDAKARITGQ